LIVAIRRRGRTADARCRRTLPDFGVPDGLHEILGINV
jgi:hypothetical protein